MRSRYYWAVLIVCVLCVWVDLAQADEQPDLRCDVLFEKAAKELAAEQYPRMLRAAEDHMRICPGPKSAFLVGLAQANMVDAQLVRDPAEREQMRKAALRNLRIAAASGTDLKPEWQFTVGEWIVNLQRRDDALEEEPDEAMTEVWTSDDSPSSTIVADSDDAEDELYVPKAPPPQPQPKFPTGPVIVGSAGILSLGTAITLAVLGGNKQDDADSGAKQIIDNYDSLTDTQLQSYTNKVQQLQHQADTLDRWALISAIGGGAAVTTAVLWYWLLPPAGKWRWAVTPTGLQVTGRF